MIHRVIYFNILTADTFVHRCLQIVIKVWRQLASLATPYSLAFRCPLQKPPCSRHTGGGTALKLCLCYRCRKLSSMLPLPLCSNTVGMNYKTATQAPRRKLQETSRQKHHKIHALAVVSLRVGLLKLQNLDPNKTSFLKWNLHPQTEQNEKS